MPISPTNGRIVWFTPTAGTDTIIQHDLNQPLAAQVCHVWGDRMVNLLVTDSDGGVHAVTSVNLLQDDDAKPEGGRFCTWMPFQKGQAAKVEAPAIDVEALTQRLLDRVKAETPAPHSILHDIEDLVERAAQKVHDKMAGVS